MTTQMDNNANKAITLHPKLLVFDELEDLNVAYCQTVSIQNSTDLNQRITVEPPTTPYFRIHIVNKGRNIAPGLNIKIRVYFQVPEGGNHSRITEFHDKVYVRYERGSIDLPLHVYLPRDDIRLLNDHHIDMGVCVPGATVCKSIEIENRGRRNGKYEVRLQQNDLFGTQLIVSPIEGVLQCGMKQTITFEYTATRNGEFSTIILIHCMPADPNVAKVASKRPPLEVNVCVQVARRQLELICADKTKKNKENLQSRRLEHIFFGNVYNGERVVHEGILINNGPLPTSFCIDLESLNDDNDDENHRHHNELQLLMHSSRSNTTNAKQQQRIMEPLGIAERPDIFVEPSQGSIKANGRVRIKFIFQPKNETRQCSWQSKLPTESYTRTITSKATIRLLGDASSDETMLNVHLNGVGVDPMLSISQTSFVFGECVVNEHCDIVCQLENRSVDLPIKFHFDTKAHFRVRPTHGMLKPLQSKNVCVSFTPKQLGKFRATIVLHVGENIKGIPLNLSGFSDRIGKKQTLVGGIDKIPQDFETTLNIVDHDNIRTHRERPAVTNKEEYEGIYKVTDNSDRRKFAYTKEERQWKGEHRKKYDDFIREQSRSKQKKRIKSGDFLSLKRKSRVLRNTHALKDMMNIDPLDPINMGMEFASGLESPRIKLPPAESSLVLTSKFTTPLHKVSQRNVAVIDNIACKRFKTHPTTQAEQRDCETELNHIELRSILAGPKTLDFNTTCIDSSLMRTFAITNDLKNQNIFVEFRRQDIDTSIHVTPESQVVPPMKSCRFQVHFRPTIVQQDFQTAVPYVLNGKHTFNCLVVANVVAKSLVLSCTTIDLQVHSDQRDFNVVKTLTAKNPFSTSIEYTWTTINVPENIIVTPSSGVVGPFQTMVSTFTYSPQSMEPSLQHEFKLCIVGGPRRIIHVSTGNPEASLRLTQRRFDFGNIGVSNIHTVTTTIKSRGSASVFRIMNLPEYLNVTPATGYLEAGRSCTLKISLNANKSMEIDTKFMIDYRGRKRTAQPLYINIKGNIVIPEIRIHQEIIDMGAIILGASSANTLTLENVSDVDANLVLNLTDFPDFQVVTSDDDDDIQVWNVCMKAHSTASCVLQFKPTKVGEYAFPLPITLKDYKGKTPDTLRQLVLGTGLKPLVICEPVEIDFNNAVLQVTNNHTNKKKNDNNKRPPSNNDLHAHQKSMVLRNLEKRRVPFRLSVDDNKTWALSVKEGVLEAEESLALIVWFRPRACGDFSSKIQLELDDTNVTYVKIPLKGSGVLPQLDFSVTKLELPHVPIGFTSSCTFYVHNRGYEEVSLKYTWSKENTTDDHVKFNVKFPQGTLMRRTGAKILPVEISFISTESTSFTKTMNFFDGVGRVFPLVVSGVCDNSVFTVQSFIDDRSNDRIMFHHDVNHGISLRTVTNLDDIKTPVLLKQPPPPSQQLTHNERERITLKFIVSYLSSNRLIPLVTCTKLQNDPSSFSDEMIANDGKLIINIVEILSGKRIVLVRNGKNKAKTSQVLLKLLSFLKLHGILLGSVKSEDLMNAKTSNSCWIYIFFQVFKVFALSRVTPNSLKRSTIISSNLLKDAVNESRKISNIYTSCELLLLQWINHHHNEEFQHMPRDIIDLKRDTIDCIPLAAILVAHVPFVRYLYDQMNIPVKTKDDCIHNANLILNAMASVGLRWYVHAEDLLYAKNNELFLLYLYLYQRLFHYIPKTTIEFRGHLQDVVMNTIELSNPSNKSIHYRAQLYGSTDFTIADEYRHIILEPNGGAIQFPIKFVGRFLTSVEARLLLVCDADSPHNGSTLVFGLKSNVENRCPTPSFNVSTRLYTEKKFTIYVQNPYNTEACFTIKLIQNLLQTPTMKRSTSISNNDHAYSKNENDGIPRGFWCTMERIRLKAKEKTQVELVYLPIVHGKYTCQILLLDENVGEFQISGTGNSQLPLPLMKYNDHMVKSIDIHFHNSQLIQARSLFEKYIKKLPRFLQKVALQELKSPYLQCMNTADKQFSITNNSPYFSVVPLLKLVRNTEMTKLEVRFDPKGSGKYRCQIVLNSTYDVRVYSLEFIVKTCAPMNIKNEKIPEIEFHCAARNTIVQDVPIINPTNDVWRLSCHIEGGSSYFSGKRTIEIQPNSTYNYRLQFHPKWICNEKAQLIISNPKTHIIPLKYTLVGVGDEPLAEDEKICLDGVVGETISYTLNVRNYTNDAIVYHVESDLLCISGPNELSVPAQTTADYTFSILPKKRGLYCGSITFRATDQTYVWYAIEVDTLVCPPEQIIPLQMVLDTPIVVEIMITNPLSKAINMEVTLQGDGLHGLSRLTMLPDSTSSYEVTVTPKSTGNHICGVYFNHDELGEFWYQLQVDVTETEPIKLPNMSTIIGTETVQSLKVTNPLENESIYVDYCTCSHDNFTIEPSNAIQILPNESANIQIIYKPTHTDIDDVCNIVLSCKCVGTFVYNVVGTGLLSSSENAMITTTSDDNKTITMVSTIHTPTSAIIHYVNQFNTLIQLSISLSSSSNEFTLLEEYHHNIIELDANQTLSIPISYRPSTKMCAKASLVLDIVSNNHAKSSSSYDLMGFPEIVGAIETRSIRSECRQLWRENLNFVIPSGCDGGIDSIDHDDVYHVEFEVEDATTTIPCDKFLKLMVLPSSSLSATENKDKENSTVTLDIQFCPLKPLHLRGILVIQHPNGAHIRYPICFKATPPPPDDIIRLRAGVNERSIVRFPLTHTTHAIFEAFITSGGTQSQSVFTVSPTMGTFQPNEDTVFEVSFCPIEYSGRVHSTLLVIETDEHYWSYELRGSLPKYRIPS